MQFTRNAHVYTVDRQPVGRITHVVLDPVTKKVTHVVVHQGIIFTEDKVIPIQMFQSLCPEGVVLREGIGDLHDLPKFEEPFYVKIGVPRNIESATLAGMVGGLYLVPPSDSERYFPDREEESQKPYYRYVQAAKQNIPVGEIALKEGAAVISADHQHIGDIESVIVDPQTDQVTDVVMSKSKLLTITRKLIPASWIQSVCEDGVYLNVDADSLTALPEYA
ncbi:MAG: PRC-barrel domain-containing protein [Anaerolineae bacterium]|nr:PRC-barrel domain-containing protein [Anaerolineae bacterium]